MKILLFILMLTSMLFAHRLYVLADDNGTNLYVKSYFTKSSPCQNCKVNIYKNKKIIDSGKTDSNGEITFKHKAKNIEIEVTASMGHKNTITYNSENEVITEDNNITAKKMFMSLGIIALIFLILRVAKK